MFANDDVTKKLAAFFTASSTGAPSLQQPGSSPIVWVTEANKNPVFLGTAPSYFDGIRREIGFRREGPDGVKLDLPDEQPIYTGAPGTFMVEAKNAALAEILQNIIRNAFSAQGIDPEAISAGDMEQDGTRFSPNTQKAKGKNLLLDLRDNTAEKLAAIESVKPKIDLAIAAEEKKRLR